MTPYDSKNLFRTSVGFVAALGLIGVLGWLGNVTAFQGVTPGWATMKPITCVFFLLSALALWLVQKPGYGVRVAQAVGALVFLGGILSLQGTLGVDRWLLIWFGGEGTYAMSLNTSLCFAASGLAISFSPMKAPLGFLTQMFAGAVAMTALVAICGYLVAAESLYTVSGFGSMAFNTSLAFGALATGIFATQPEVGIIRVWGQQNATGATLRRLFPVVAGMPLLLGWGAHHGVMSGFYDSEFALALIISACSALIGLYAIWSASAQGHVEQSLIERKANERFVLGLSEAVQAYPEPDQLVEFVCEAIKERLNLDGCELATSGPFPQSMQTQEMSQLVPAGASAFAIAPVPIANPAAALVASTRYARTWSKETLNLLSDAAETLWRLRERCTAAAALQASERDLALTMNSITDGIITTDESGRVKRINPMASNILGIPAAELIGSLLEAVFPLDDFKRSGEISDRHIVNLEGQSRSIRSRISKVEGGTFAQVLVLRDIQENYLAELELQHSEARKSAILQSAFDPIVSMNHLGEIVEFNEAAERVFGYSQAEAMGQRVADLVIPPRLREAHNKGLVRLLETGETRLLGRVVEVPSMHRDGTEIPTEIAIMQVVGQDPPLFTSIIRDLRIRHQAHEQFKVAMEAAPVGMIMVDLDGRIALVNRKVENIFGYTREELLGSAIEILIPKRYAHKHPANREVFHFNPVARLMGERSEIYGACKDGLEVPLEIALNPVETPDGKFVLCSVEDITIRKRQEDERTTMVLQLRRLNAELAKSLGEREVLLQEVHHRVKNNLQVISSLINIQVRNVADSSAIAALMECKTRVEAISLIHEKLYQSDDYAEVPFANYVNELVDNISEAIGTPMIRISVDVDDFSLNVNKAIPCGLVINELVTNAVRHAFEPDTTGRISVSLRRTTGNQVALSVSDDGAGMVPDAGRPNSLGLHLVSTLVRQLRGELEITTDEGTRFTVTFPTTNDSEFL